MTKKIVRELLTKWVYQVDTKQVKQAKKQIQGIRSELSKVKKSSVAFEKSEMARIERLKKNWKGLSNSVEGYRKNVKKASEQKKAIVGLPIGSGRQRRQAMRDQQGGRGGSGGVSAMNSAAFLAGRIVGNSAITSALLGGAGLATGFAAVSGVQAAADRETYQKRFEGLLGGVQEADSFLETMTEFAKRTPFAITQLRELSTMALGGGFKSGEIVPLFERLGDVTQGNSVQFRRLLINMSEIRNVGKAYTKDIRQFGTAGIPLREQLVKDFQVTGEELDNMISKGKVGYAAITKALDNLRKAQFKGAMSKQLNTFNQSLSNLGDTITQLAEVLFAPILPFLTRIVQGVTSLLNVVTGFFSGLFNSVSLFADFIGWDWDLFFENMKKGFLGLAITIGAVMAALNPLLAGITAIALLIEDIVAYRQGRGSIVGEFLGVDYDPETGLAIRNPKPSPERYKVGETPGFITGAISSGLSFIGEKLGIGDSTKTNNVNQTNNFNVNSSDEAADALMGTAIGSISNLAGAVDKPSFQQ